jgi:hypothetical protein
MKYLSLFFALTFFSLQHNFAQPVHDECVNASLISVNVTNYYSTSNATTSEIETEIGVIYKDVWYAFTANEDSTFLVSTCLSYFDTKIAIYDKGCGNIVDYSEWKYNDDTYNCEDDLNSEIKFEGKQGTTYLLRIGGYDSLNYGDGSITIEYTEPIKPVVNDSCHGAIASTVVLDEASCQPSYVLMEGSTMTEGGPYCYQGNDEDVWFTFNSQTFDFIWPKMSFEGEVFSGGMGEFFTLYTDCNGTLDEYLSGQCDSDTIKGFNSNTDYWFKLSLPASEVTFKIELCFVGGYFTNVTENEVNTTIQLSPNPAKEEVHITLQQPGNHQINLLDMTGKIVLSQQVNTQKIVLQLHDIPTGVYNMQVVGTDFQRNQRLVIE